MVQTRSKLENPVYRLQATACPSRLRLHTVPGGLALLARLAGDSVAAQSKSAAADTQRQLLRILAVLSANPRTFTALLHGNGTAQSAHVGGAYTADAAVAAANAGDWRPWIVLCGRGAVDRKTRAYASRALFNLDAMTAAHAPHAGGSHETPHLLHDGIHPLTPHPSCDETKARVASAALPQRGAWPQWLPRWDGRGGGMGSAEDGGVSAPAPVMDVVFLHGLRGGAFSTWRNTPPPGATEDMQSCWPADWLAADLPVRAHPLAFREYVELAWRQLIEYQPRGRSRPAR